MKNEVEELSSMFEPKQREVIWSISVHEGIELTKFLEFEGQRPKDERGYFLHKIEKFEGVEPDFNKESYTPQDGEWCFFRVAGYTTLLKFSRMLKDGYYQAVTQTGAAYNSYSCQKAECEFPKIIKDLIG